MTKHDYRLALKSRISPKSSVQNMDDTYARADEALGIIDEKNRITSRTVCFRQEDLDNIKLLQEKLIDQRIYLNFNQIVRLAVNAALELPKNELLTIAQKLPKVSPGRPRLNKLNKFNN